MSIKRRTVITIEEKSIAVLHSQKRAHLSFFCASCGANVLMLTVEEAARIFETTQLNIFRMVENNLVHFIETQTGLLLICKKSLQGLIENT